MNGKWQTKETIKCCKVDNKTIYYESESSYNFNNNWDWKLIQIHYVLFINNVINVQQQWLNHINVNKNQQIIIKMDKRLMMMKKMNHNRIKISCDI